VDNRCGGATEGEVVAETGEAGEGVTGEVPGGSGRAEAGQ